MAEILGSELTGNPGVLKRINRVRVLRHLRLGGPASRAELARATGLDAKTITNVSNSLLRDGLIESGKLVAAGRGRPAEDLALQGGAAYAIGVDVGAQQVTAAAVDFQGQVVGKWRQTFSGLKNKEYVLGKAEEGVSYLLAELGGAKVKRVRGLGVAVPGILNRAKGVVIRSVNIRGFEDLGLCGWLAGRFGREVVLEESSRAMALAEIWFGGRAGEQDFLLIDLGFGIGMGIVSQGRLYRGAHEASGEIGHTVVRPGGQRCRCGKRGCLETVASGRALGKLAEGLGLREKGIELAGAQAVSEAARAGNGQARELLRAAGESIGMAVANVMNLFDPECVVLNGSLTEAGEYLVGPLKEAIGRHGIGFFKRQIRVEVSRLGKVAGALGAAILPMKGYFEMENVRF